MTLPSGEKGYTRRTVAGVRAHAGVEFVIHGKAEPAGSKRAFVMNGRAIVTDANAKSRPWKTQVSAAAVEAVGEDGLLEGPLFLRVAFYEPRPRGHFNSKSELNAQGRRNPWPTKKPDATKLLRAVEDAMSGIVYRDDSQIVHQVVTKHYGEPARVYIRVAPLFSLEGMWTNSKNVASSIS